MLKASYHAWFRAQRDFYKLLLLITQHSFRQQRTQGWKEQHRWVWDLGRFSKLRNTMLGGQGFQASSSRSLAPNICIFFYYRKLKKPSMSIFFSLYNQQAFLLVHHSLRSSYRKKWKAWRWRDNRFWNSIVSEARSHNTWQLTGNSALNHWLIRQRCEKGNLSTDLITTMMRPIKEGMWIQNVTHTAWGAGASFQFLPCITNLHRKNICKCQNSAGFILVLLFRCFMLAFI